MDKCANCGMKKSEHFPWYTKGRQHYWCSLCDGSTRFVAAEPPCYECGGSGTIESGRTCPTCWGRAMRGEDSLEQPSPLRQVSGSTSDSTAHPPVECAHYVYWQAATETYICNRCGVTLVFRPAAQWAAVTGLAWKARWLADRLDSLATDRIVHEDVRGWCSTMLDTAVEVANELEQALADEVNDE